MVNDPINPWLDADELKQLAESLMQGGAKSRKPMPQDAGFGDAFVGFAGSEKPISNPPPAAATSTPAIAQSVATPKPASVAASQSATAPPAPLPPAVPATQRSTFAPPEQQSTVSNGKPMEPISPPPAREISTPPASQLISAPQPARPVASLAPTQAKVTTTPQSIETHPSSSRSSAPSIHLEKSAQLVAPATSSNEPEQQCLQLQSDMQHQYGSGPIFILNRNGHTVFGKENHPQFQFIAQSLTKHSKRRGLPKGHIHIKVGPDQILEIIPVDLPNGGWVVGSLVSKPLQPEEISHWVREVTKLSSTLIQL